MSKLKGKWYLDSGCSNHMTNSYNLFATLSREFEGGNVTFGDNSKGKILGIGNIPINSSNFIENVLLVDGLKHNLISISQLCDKGYIVIFDKNECKVMNNDNCILLGKRYQGTHIIDINVLLDETCLAAIKDDAWLWHRRLGHTSMDTLNKIASKSLVR